MIKNNIPIEKLNEFNRILHNKLEKNLLENDNYSQLAIADIYIHYFYQLKLEIDIQLDMEIATEIAGKRPFIGEKSL